MIELIALTACLRTQKIKPDTFCIAMYPATYTKTDLEVASDILIKFLDDYQAFYKIHCKK